MGRMSGHMTSVRSRSGCDRLVAHGVSEQIITPVAPAIGSSRPGERKDQKPRADLVLDQLGRILESPGFRNSKRYAAVLRYIVEQTLNGNADQLKERTIGVDIFGRTPDYDTASDHVVRSAMAEVRKRLAQYYAEPAPSDEL